MDKITCPKCLSTDLYRYGKEKHTGLQKFMCKHCKTQFVPNRPYNPKSKTTDYGYCPICGSKLHLRKRNKNSIQLRCSKRPICKYTISLPINNKLPTDINVDIKLPKFFRYPITMIIKAINLYFHYQLSSRQIVQKLKPFFSNTPSHSTIISWCRAFSSFFKSLYTNISKPMSYPHTWLIDETIIKIHGQKVFLFAVLDYSSRFLLSFHISLTKDLNQAIASLKKALQFTNSKPSTIISDRAQHLAIAVKSVFGNSVVHKRVSLYSKNPSYSNNRIERFFSTFKEYFKRRRNPKTLLTLMLFSHTYALLYNFARFHSGINSIPAQSLGVKILAYNQYLEVFLKCSI